MLWPLRALRGELKIDAPKAAAATVFDFSAASLVVTRSPSQCNILIIRGTVLISKVIWIWVGKHLTAYVHTHFLHDTFFSAHIT